MMVTAGTELYGNLPMFPCLDYAPITEQRLERAVERLVDVADAIFLKGGATQTQYDAWSRQLNIWATLQATKVVQPKTYATHEAALDAVPAGAEWSCSFGYPGEGGFVEYYRAADGASYKVSNGAYWASRPFAWTVELVPAAQA